MPFNVFSEVVEHAASILDSNSVSWGIEGSAFSVVVVVVALVADAADEVFSSWYSEKKKSTEEHISNSSHHSFSWK